MCNSNEPEIPDLDPYMGLMQDPKFKAAAKRLGIKDVTNRDEYKKINREAIAYEVNQYRLGDDAKQFRIAERELYESGKLKAKEGRVTSEEQWVKRKVKKGDYKNEKLAQQAFNQRAKEEGRNFYLQNQTDTLDDVIAIRQQMAIRAAEKAKATYRNTVADTNEKLDELANKVQNTNTFEPPSNQSLFDPPKSNTLLEAFGQGINNLGAKMPGNAQDITTFTDQLNSQDNITKSMIKKALEARNREQERYANMLKDMQNMSMQIQPTPTIKPPNFQVPLKSFTAPTLVAAPGMQIGDSPLPSMTGFNVRKPATVLSSKTASSRERLRTKGTQSLRIQ